MKPWTERKQITSALRNEGVRIGERTLKDGTVLRGIYATRDFAADDYVASYHGKIISHAEFFQLFETDPALFERINEYGVSTPTDDHLYTDDIDAIGAHLINHSCRPTLKWAQLERGALLVRAIRPIKAGEEVTIFYGWLGMKHAIDHQPQTKCSCSAPYCVGTIQLGTEWHEFDDGTVGPNLPIEEVGRRFLADIVNGTDAHEALLLSYPKGSLAMVPSAKPIEKFDYHAYALKLQEGALIAARAARKVRATGHAISESRLRQIARVHELPASEIA